MFQRLSNLRSASIKSELSPALPVSLQWCLQYSWVCEMDRLAKTHTSILRSRHPLLVCTSIVEYHEINPVIFQTSLLPTKGGTGVPIQVAPSQSSRSGPTLRTSKIDAVGGTIARSHSICWPWWSAFSCKLRSTKRDEKPFPASANRGTV